MDYKFTPGKWSQGITLHTKITSKWTKEQIESNDLKEKLHVFAGFEGFDEGKSRILVAACTNEHDARLIAAAPEMLKFLIKEDEKYSKSGGLSADMMIQWDKIKELIKMATE